VYELHIQNASTCDNCFHALGLAQSVAAFSLIRHRCQNHVTATYLFLTFNIFKIQKYFSDYFRHVRFIEVLNPKKLGFSMNFTAWSPYRWSIGEFGQTRAAARGPLPGGSGAPQKVQNGDWKLEKS